MCMEYSIYTPTCNKAGMKLKSVNSQLKQSLKIQTRSLWSELICEGYNNHLIKSIKGTKKYASGKRRQCYDKI